MAGRTVYGAGRGSRPGSGTYGHFTPGCWRPDRPTGHVAIPEGPPAGWTPPPEPVAEAVRGDRVRDARTLANEAAHAEALKPRRYVPPAEREG